VRLTSVPLEVRSRRFPDHAVEAPLFLRDALFFRIIFYGARGCLLFFFFSPASDYFNAVSHPSLKGEWTAILPQIIYFRGTRMVTPLSCCRLLDEATHFETDIPLPRSGVGFNPRDFSLLSLLDSLITEAFSSPCNCPFFFCDTVERFFSILCSFFSFQEESWSAPPSCDSMRRTCPFPLWSHFVFSYGLADAGLSLVEIGFPSFSKKGFSS